MENYKVKLTLTEESNVDFGNRKIKDQSKIFFKIFNWGESVDIYDTIVADLDKIKVANISLYDHLLILDGKRHKILRFYSSDSIKE
jgi:hypothetical protein